MFSFFYLFNSFDEKRFHAKIVSMFSAALNLQSLSSSGDLQAALGSLGLRTVPVERLQELAKFERLTSDITIAARLGQAHLELIMPTRVACANDFPRKIPRIRTPNGWVPNSRGVGSLATSSP